jgi:hypothetical protein
MFTRPLGQGLATTTIGLNGSLKRIDHGRRVIQRFAVGMVKAQIKAQLLPMISPHEPVAHNPLTLLGRHRSVHRGRQPASVAFLTRRPSESSIRTVAFVLLGRKELGRRSHAVPSPRSPDVGQPLCKRRTWSPAFLGRRVKHHHVIACVQEMAKVMTAAPDQQIGLKQAQLELSLRIQPRYGWGPH